jgi:hypothetical protein
MIFADKELLCGRFTAFILKIHVNPDNLRHPRAKKTNLYKSVDNILLLSSLPFPSGEFLFGVLA